MPYSIEHKQQTRERIVVCARQLFNRRGFTEVSIDEVMAAAGLTRGGFYNHFKTKEDLYVATLVDYAMHKETGASNSSQCGPEIAWQIFDRYVSRQHLEDMGGHCPLMALPSDVARAGRRVRAAYQRVLEAMVGIFEANVGTVKNLSARQESLAIAATCVGAMVLSRTVDDSELADEICDAVRAFASDAICWHETNDHPSGT